MARLAVTHKDVGTIAHWCARCASLQPVALVHQVVEGRVMYAVSLGGAEVWAAIGACLRCKTERAISPSRFPVASAAKRPIKNFEALIVETNPVVIAQRARLERLRERALSETTQAHLASILGHPRAEVLLGLAESGDAGLADQIDAALRGIDSEARCDELARSVAGTYPGAAGLLPGLTTLLAVLSVAYLVDAPAWGWIVAALVAGVLARLVIGRLREQRVKRFLAEVLSPALARDELDATAFLDAIARYRNGGPGSFPALQDMANDHPLLSRLLGATGHG